jgi:hypothetical protein
MSLITSASPWTNTNNQNKKRVPSLRRHAANDDVSEHEVERENFKNRKVETFEDLNEKNDKKAMKINDLLEKMTSMDDTDNDNMGDFKPLEPPTVQMKKDIQTEALSESFVPKMPSFAEASIENKETNKNNRFVANYVANEGNSNVYSQYSKTYQPSVPYYQKMGVGSDLGDNQLMEKINYMIHLLEQQQHEKTDNITEEFLLYTFLGVFVIYVVDSFSRSGKYVR